MGMDKPRGWDIFLLVFSLYLRRGVRDPLNQLSFESKMKKNCLLSPCNEYFLVFAEIELGVIWGIIFSASRSLK